MPRTISVARGDGIGPEITDAVLRILEAAGAPVEIEQITVGKKVYESGVSSGIPAEAWESMLRTGVLLKGPITTPQGGGYKSLNVTIRKSLGLFANVRPVRSLAPFVATNHPTMDLAIVRENEEDLYAGIEHRQTDEVVQCLKLISRPGSERLIRYAFEYATCHNRNRVTCMVKDNIMKLTDGLFRSVFNEVAADYPSIEAEHFIVDIGMARVADQPERFQVIVVPNLYGDIVSDIAAEVSGSVGLAGSANIGEKFAMFEAIHGSAPDIAGQNIANPSGMLQGAVKMLQHIGHGEVGERVQNAWLATIEAGIHTVDIYRRGRSERRATTSDFADAVIERLGEKPQTLRPASYAREAVPMHAIQRREPARKELAGVDVFVHWRGQDPAKLAATLEAAHQSDLPLRMISNRGLAVWPGDLPETLCTDHWRCRFEAAEGSPVEPRAVVALLGRVCDTGLDFIKTEHLYTFDGVPGYSGAQGQ